MISIDNAEHMFEQKYRPTTIDECILPSRDKALFKTLVKKGQIPHLILVSTQPGTGKTTVAKALCNEINADMLFINGADCRIDFIRSELTRFASSSSLEGRPKVIVIDEFDRAGLGDAQRHLRSFMETYSKNCSIIITANNLEGIINPLQNRCRVIKFAEPTLEDQNSMMKEMIHRLVAICKNENIEIEDMKVVAALVKKTFPSFRRTVNTLEQYGINGKLDAGILGIIMTERGAIADVIDAIKDRNIGELRKLALKYSNDYPSFVDKLATELYDVVSGPSKIRMYEIIGENNQYFGLAANAEIHLAYMLIQLAVEMKC